MVPRRWCCQLDAVLTTALQNADKTLTTAQPRQVIASCRRARYHCHGILCQRGRKVNRGSAERGAAGAVRLRSLAPRSGKEHELAIPLAAGVRRRMHQTGGWGWQVASRWRHYIAYLGEVERQLGTMQWPGLGTIALGNGFTPVRLQPCSSPVRLGEEAANGDAVELSLAQALARDSRLLIVGPTGTGKSALLRSHAAELARAARLAGRRILLSETGPPPLPIYHSLTSPQLSEPFETQLRQSMASLGFPSAEDFLRAHLAAGRVAVLIDDFDQLGAADRRRAAATISQLVQEYPHCHYVVAARDVADRRWFQGFTPLTIAGVAPSQVETLLARLSSEYANSIEALLQVVERSPLVRSLLSRPGWLAAVLAAVGQRQGQLRVFDVVHGFVAQIENNGHEIWAEVALNWHRARTTFGEAASIPSELRGSGLLEWLSASKVRFIHPAVQAYFAAWNASLPELVSGAGDRWWEPVIVLSAGHMADAQPLVAGLLDRGQATLAALALVEASSPIDGLQERTLIDLLESLGQHNREADLQVAIAMASLLQLETVRRTGLAAPALAALDDPSAAVRCAAAAALGRLGDPAAIAPLLTALGDPDRATREAASEALAAFGDRTVQPLVRQLTVPSPEVRQAAVQALARQGARAVPSLINLLEGQSATVRTEAAEALAAIGEPAVPALITVLVGNPVEAGGPSPAVIGASEALRRIGRPAVEALLPVYAEANPTTRRLVVETLLAIGREAVEALGKIIGNPDHPQANTAAAMLGELAPLGHAAAPFLAAAINDPRYEVRWETRRSLRRLGATATESLVAALDCPDAEVRWQAAQILLELPDPPTERLTSVLAEALALPDVHARRRAVRALGALSGPKVQALLERAIDDADPLVRRLAAAQLGHMGREAANILVRRWREETEPEVALAILQTLAELDPEGAIGTLIDALASDDARLRQTAVELLVETGEPAVVPLIKALNQRPAEIDLEAALKVLERAGMQLRAGGRSPAMLARVYHRMVVEPLELDELVYLATTIEWWPHALELHRTFATARTFLEYNSLGGIGSAESALTWIDAIDEWLRPATQRALRQLRLISQAVQYYNRGASRRAKEKGLLAAADRLNALRSMINELGEPHARVFASVEDHWSQLVNHAIRELQGKAELDLDMRTEHVRIQDSPTAVVLVFELLNRGEGLASNVQMTLQVDGEALHLESAPTHYLPPLGQGDAIRAEFTVRRAGSGTVPITVDVRYDDPQREGQTRTFVRQVRFFVEETEYREIGSSPYIAGPPVKTPEMFYGRQPIFTWIQENLSGTYQDNVLVLYGERRTGKTSVLYQLHYHLPSTYAFVLIDLQSIAYALGSTGDLLYAMARKAISGLRRLGLELEPPQREDYEEHPIETFEILGERIGQLATATSRRAVLMTDEFDLLIEAVDSGRVSPYVFDCIRGLMQHQEGLSFIFAGAHRLSAMLKNPQSILFNTALRRKVSFLDRTDAERLIREPVADVLFYDELAVEKILRVTAGHPYFVQYICHEIVNMARRERKNFVALRDVDRALQTTVHETTGIIRHAYMSLSQQEQIVLAAIARITDDGRPYVGLEDIGETLRQDDINLSKRDLFETLRHLVERDFVTERGGESAGRQYRFTMELVRVWLEQNDEYRRLLEELHP